MNILSVTYLWTAPISAVWIMLKTDVSAQNLQIWNAQSLSHTAQGNWWWALSPKQLLSCPRIIDCSCYMCVFVVFLCSLTLIFQNFFSYISVQVIHCGPHLVVSIAAQSTLRLQYLALISSQKIKFYSFLSWSGISMNLAGMHVQSLRDIISTISFRSGSFQLLRWL